MKYLNYILSLAIIVSDAFILVSSRRGIGAADLVKEYVDNVWNNKNIQALEKYVVKDYVRKAAVFPRLNQELEQQLAQRGIKGWRNYLTRVFNAIPDMNVELEDVIAEGNQVYATVITSGTQIRSSWGHPTGKYFETKCAAHYRLTAPSGGKIAFTEMFCDFSGLMQHFAPSTITIDHSKHPESGIMGSIPSGALGYQPRVMRAVSMDNLNSGIESILAGKILTLSDAYNSQKPKAVIVPLHDVDRYRAVSPAHPLGLTAHEEVDFYLGWSKCMSGEKPNQKAKVELQHFYFDDFGRGVTVSWKMTGIHTKQCPKPYDQFTPTKKALTLNGISYHRFSVNGLLLEKMTVFDNEYLKMALKGDAPSEIM